MNKLAVFAIFAAATLAPLGAAQAQMNDPPRQPGYPPAFYSPWYINLSAGAAFPQNTNISAGPFSGNIEYGTGMHGFVGLGYQFNPWLAGELEVGYLRLPIDRINLNGATASVDGSLHGLAFFANAVASLDMNLVRPYIAAGPGLVHRFGSDVTVTSGGATATADIGSGTDFAVQAKAGIDLRISDRMSVAPEYRYTWVNTSGDGLGNTKIHSVGASFKIRF